MDQGLKIALDRDFIVTIECAHCRVQHPVMKPRSQVSMKQAHCPQCDELARPNTTHVIKADSSLAEEKLDRLGIPPYDIVRVSDAQTEKPFLLAADRHE